MEKLFKYRNWDDENHRKMLTHSELYLASPKDFNDPFDSKIRLDYSSLDENETISFVDLLIDKMKSKRLKERGISESALRKKMIKNFSSNPRHFHEFINNESEDAINIGMGIFSLAKRWDNILLWSHYANNHKGFCVEFNKNVLDDYFQDGAQGPVIYPTDDQYPKLHPIHTDQNELFFRRIYTKSKVWSYEEEYRYSKIVVKTDLHESKPRVINFDSNLISEVIIGSEAEKKVIDEIKSVCSQKNIPVSIAIRKEFEFGLDKDSA